MRTPHHCWDGGYLVGNDDWFPTDARDHYAALGPYVGCNALSCTLCGQKVRSLLGYWEVPKVPAPELFAVPRWEDVEGLAPRAATGRLYTCTCQALVAHATKRLIPAPDDLDPDVLPPWRCDGHPTLDLPGQLGGMTIPANDWESFAASNVAVAGRPPLHPSVDKMPGFLLTRVYLALGDKAARSRLSNAIGDHADSADREARTGVSLFFAMCPAAPGLDALVAAWRAAPTLYDHQPSPWPSEPTLRDLNLKAVASRLYIRRKRGQPYDGDLATIHWAALTAPGLGSYVFSMSSIDPAWAATNVQGIIAANPARWGSVLRALTLTLDQLIATARWLVASHHATTEAVLSVIRETHPDWITQAGEALARA